VRNAVTFVAAGLLVLFVAAPATADEPIRLANHPALSPDGATLVFDWNGDVWSVPVNGGEAKQLTQHPARDREPKFSPDGKEIAFVSDRTGSAQVFVMPAKGGAPRQRTFHTAGYSLQEWCPDGKRLLVSASRDHYWRHAERFFAIDAAERKAEELLFDDYGQNGCLSPDGKRLLFTREGPVWWRKGYRGSQASQVWLYDRGKNSFTKVLDDDRGCLWPLWRPDGKAFYFVGGKSGSFNLWEHDLDSGKQRQLTHFKDDSVVFPCISRDGSTIVFRHLFDLYCLRTGNGEAPKKIAITCATDRSRDRVERRTLAQATQVAFTRDGLEIAFIAGGDLWVMDTELREPRQVTATAEEERHPVFASDGQSLLFVADRDAKSDVWKAEKADKAKYWWQQASFKLTKLTHDGEVKSRLTFSPDGSRIAYLRNRGDLWVADADGRNAKKVVPSWNALEYSWSPDGKWLVYAQDDEDFNRDIWVLPLDGSRKPYNLSRHPFNDYDPVWSPDGRVIAFIGQRGTGQTDVFYVFLRTDDAEKSGRDRSLEKALEKMNKVRNPMGRAFGPRDPGAKDADAKDDKPIAKAGPEVVIDFERLHERVRRVSLPDAAKSGLFWSPDSKKLAFTATIEGRRGTYTIDVPDDLQPKLLTTQTGAQPRWLRQGNQIVWLSGGVPASFAPGGGGGGAARAATPMGPTTPRRGRGGQAPTAPSTGDDATGSGYRFQALQEVDLAKRNLAAFDLCWRTMRDNWYDERLGNRDWNAVRTKYRAMAGEASDRETFATVVQLMLGELNGSHLGFTPSGGGAGPRIGRRGQPAGDTSAAWTETTGHLGLRFERDFKGPGLKIRDVLPGGPAEQKRSRLAAGEVVLRIDGKDVGPATDLTTVLNGRPGREVRLQVRGQDGKEREVALRPISYAQTRPLLYEAWLEGNRKAVEKASGGKLGYLHIAAMNMPSFYRFEEELYKVGAGKEGLVIDVRENGGGSTTDHLLTALTQPRHAYTVPRGGDTPGYPHDRKVYATWNKPIVVLCNQNSFSNAEIFSHAIKTLKRGQLVGVPTAGGVISTGATTIMDVGTLRLPFRGWFLLNDGEDMELNGAVPDHVVWPKPGRMPQGKDAQLAKAVEVLQADVKAWKQRPRPNLRKATERPANDK
jgi:tricorn protease